MGLLGTSSAITPQYASLGDFLKSDDAMALAAGLLSTPRGGTFAQGVGQGLYNMQTMKSQGLKNQLTSLQLQQLQQQLQGQKDLRDAINGAFTQNPSQNQAPSPLTPAQQAAMNSIKMSPDMQSAMSNLMAPSSQSQPSQSMLTSPGTGVNPDAVKKIALGYVASGQTDKALKLIGWDPSERTALQKNLIAAGLKPGTPEYQQAIMQAISKPNMQLSMDPTTGQVMFTQNTLPDGWVKDPKMGPARGGQGGTYTDKQTGQVISTETNKQTSADQQAIAGIQRAQDQLTQAVKNLPQFQTAAMQGLNNLEKGSNYLFGTNFQLPSKFNEGQSNLKIAVESLMKSYTLPSTDKAIDLMLDAYKPGFGESAEGYTGRITRAIEHLHQMDVWSKQRIGKGIDLTEALKDPAGYENSLSQLGNQTQDVSNQNIPTNSSQSQQIFTYDPKTRSLK